MFKKNFLFKVLTFLIVMLTFNIVEVEARRVKVRGYYRKDGTYVRPHYRTAPDGNPYNNYSFPGNYNPNTGKVTTGNPSTYLKRYYNRSSSTSSSVPTYNQSYRSSASKSVKDLRFNSYDWKGLDTNKLRVSNASSRPSYTLDVQKMRLERAQNELLKVRRELHKQRLAHQKEMQKLRNQLEALKMDQQVEYKKKYNNAVRNDNYELALVYSYLIDDFDEKRRNTLIRLSRTK